MLNDLLQNFGVHDYSQLKADERKTYDTWAKILSTPDPTLDDVRKFLAAENERAHAELAQFENSKDKQIYYAALDHLTSTLSKFLAGPGAQRDALKAHLKQVFQIEM